MSTAMLTGSSSDTHTISLSHHRMTKCTDKLHPTYNRSDASDTATEVSDTAQLAVLVPRVDAEFNVTLNVKTSPQF